MCRRRVNSYRDQGTAELDLRCSWEADPSAAMQSSSRSAAAATNAKPPALPPRPSSGAPSCPLPSPGATDRGVDHHLLRVGADLVALEETPLRLQKLLTALRAECDHLEAWVKRFSPDDAGKTCPDGYDLSDLDRVQTALSYLSAADCHMRAAQQRLGRFPVRQSEF